MSAYGVCKEREAKHAERQKRQTNSKWKTTDHPVLQLQHNSFLGMAFEERFSEPKDTGLIILHYRLQLFVVTNKDNLPGT